jgi:nitrite reductase (NADH) large subunit
MNSKTVVVVGNGMVGHKFIETMISRGEHLNWNVVTFCEEPRLAYDRVYLSSFFAGKTAEDLSLLPKPTYYADHGITVHLRDQVASIDKAAKTVTSAKGVVIAYDKLVLATGSFPFVPPVTGRDATGCFVYRTIEDLIGMQNHATSSKIGVVIGGGLLGLECASALKNMGLETHVVEFSPRLMTVQVDEGGGAILKRKIESLGVKVHLNKNTSEIVKTAEGRIEKMTFADKSELKTDMIVFSAGIRPRDELGKSTGLVMGERGGIHVDEHCVTSDPDILAIGEVAVYKKFIYGLVAPGYHMATVAVDTITASFGGKAEGARFTGFDMSTKLKLMGVEVGSFGDAMGSTPGCHVASFTDSNAEVYRKLVLSADRKTLLGGVLVGDTSAYGTLHQFMLNKVAMPANPEDLILPTRSGAKPAGMGVESLPEAATICSCHNITKGTICGAIDSQQLREVSDVKRCTKAGTGCGSCVSLIKDLLKDTLTKKGITVTNHVCEHFAYSRQELASLVRLGKLKTFDALLHAHGSGEGCEICKPAIGSILASSWNEHVLEKKHAPLQDTNDRFLANMQRDGTYSVVPRVPGGEITADQLICLGTVAKKYNLYSKITGGQRVDLFGARVEQLPLIWEELLQVGFESGHAYGKALRTVKSCVGSTWCRYGVQDSVGFAIKIENRYKGLRSPHKLKGGVSGCARECAEAQGKDFGIIATENGYNLYVCGNGGMKPQHAQLLAADLDETACMALIDRFLMFYIRTADRLERTAPWFNKLEGGIDYLKEVLIDDKLGICSELEGEMQRVVDAYQDEWRTAIESPDKRRQFRAFVNSPLADPTIVMVEERGQIRPAFFEEKAANLDTLMQV